jgi:hypothetical protein
VFEIRSINGAHLKSILAKNYPSLYTIALPRLARDLGISKRTLYAYIQEERRVPESVEERIIELFGEVPASGWRVVTADFIRRDQREPIAITTQPASALPLEVEANADWTEIAKASVQAVAVRLHGHDLGEWIGNPETPGADGNSLDLVAECRRCGMLVAIDAGLQEVNGFAWTAFCGSQNLWKGAR